jgi:hypothetical protein
MSTSFYTITNFYIHFHMKYLRLWVQALTFHGRLQGRLESLRREFTSYKTYHVDSLVKHVFRATFLSFLRVGLKAIDKWDITLRRIDLEVTVTECYKEGYGSAISPYRCQTERIRIRLDLHENLDMKWRVRLSPRWVPFIFQSR